MFSVNCQLHHGSLLHNPVMLSLANFTDTAAFGGPPLWAHASADDDVRIPNVFVSKLCVLRLSHKFWPLETLREATDEFADYWMKQRALAVVRTLPMS